MAPDDDFLDRLEANLLTVMAGRAGRGSDCKLVVDESTTWHIGQHKPTYARSTPHCLEPELHWCLQPGSPDLIEIDRLCTAGTPVEWAVAFVAGERTTGVDSSDTI